MMEDAAAQRSGAARRRFRSRTGATRRIWKLAWPVIVTNLLQNVGGLVSLVVIGTAIGAEGLAARNVGMRVFFTLEVFLLAVSTGTTALVARHWGADNRDEAVRVTRTSLWLSLIISLLITFPVVLGAEFLAGLFDMEPEATRMAAIFIRWAGAGTLVFALNFVPMAALRAAGDTITPMWLGGITSLVGVAIIYAVVGGAFGLPMLGMNGVGLSLLASFGASGVLCTALWMSGRFVVGFGAPGDDWNLERIRLLFRIGLPAGLEHGAFSLGIAGFVYFVTKYGTAANAAYGIGVDILALSFLLGFGFSIAASTLVGQQLGARDPEGAARSGWRALWLAILVMTGFGLSIIAVAEPFASLFVRDDPEVVRLTVVFIYLLGSVQPLMAVEFTLGGALRGAGDTRSPLYIMLSGLLLRLCATAFVTLELKWDVEWVYAMLVPDYILKGALYIWRFRSGRWVHAVTVRAGAES